VSSAEGKEKAPPSSETVYKIANFPEIAPRNGETPRLAGGVYRILTNTVVKGENRDGGIRDLHGTSESEVRIGYSPSAGEGAEAHEMRAIKT
jgi:hypothetical protein